VLIVVVIEVPVWGMPSMKQDHQALLEAKYRPRVATASCTQKKKHKKHATLTFDRWPWNSIRFWRLSRYVCVQNIIKLSAAVHELSWSQRKTNSRRKQYSPSLPRGQQKWSLNIATREHNWMVRCCGLSMPRPNEFLVQNYCGKPTHFSISRIWSLPQNVQKRFHLLAGLKSFFVHPVLPGIVHVVHKWQQV